MHIFSNYERFSKKKRSRCASAIKAPPAHLVLKRRCRMTGYDFLLDSGSHLSLIPATLKDKKHPQDGTLYAANGSEIPCFGNKTLVVDLGLDRKFTFEFVVADIVKYGKKEFKPKDYRNW